MKAIVVHQYGGPEVLKFEDYPDPVPGAGEVLVRVAATSVNPIDYKRRAGLTKDFYPMTFPGLIGVDIAGTVVKIGPGVEGFSVGRRKDRREADRQGQAGRGVCIGCRATAERCEVSIGKGGACILEIRQENARVHGRSGARWQVGNPDQPETATQRSGRGSSSGREGWCRQDLI